MNTAQQTLISWASELAKQHSPIELTRDEVLMLLHNISNGAGLSDLRQFEVDFWIDSVREDRWHLVPGGLRSRETNKYLGFLSLNDFDGCSNHDLKVLLATILFKKLKITGS